jgi:hypothetical protein
MRRGIFGIEKHGKIEDSSYQRLCWACWKWNENRPDRQVVRYDLITKDITRRFTKEECEDQLRRFPQPQSQDRR